MKPVQPAVCARTRAACSPTRGAISKNASYFNSHRMMRRYAAEAYI